MQQCKACESAEKDALHPAFESGCHGCYARSFAMGICSTWKHDLESGKEAVEAWIEKIQQQRESQR